MGHKILQWKCKACQSLKNEWYEYLQKTGFVDIERITDNLKIHNDFQTINNFQAKQNYFQWAKEKLNNTEFHSQRDKLIWEYHSDGLSSRKMSPRIGLEQSWLFRKVNQIKDYLTQIGSMSCQLAVS
jgi:hypothetical protein